MNKAKNLNTFLILWIGITLSTIGSQMTNFAVTLWAWEATEKATPLALILFFTQTPRIIASLFAGVIVDSWNRKYLMMLGDSVSAISTVIILGLFLTNNLQIWHLYLTGAINGLFSYFQDLAFSTSMTMIVPKEHYTRATVMEDYLTYSGGEILAPFLATFIYYQFNLKGVLIIDLLTFLCAIFTVIIVKVPQPQATVNHRESIYNKLTFGFRYIFSHPSLLSLLLFLLSANFVSNIAWGIFPAMILARSNNSGEILAYVQGTMGLGGVIGGIAFTFWGGFKNRVNGLLLGNILTEFSSCLIGLFKIPYLWMLSGFFMSFFAPLIGSSNQSIWLSKIDPSIQGRVFASRYFIAQVMSPLGLLISGFLADNFFEKNISYFSFLNPIFGNEEGAGMALQYALFSACGIIITLFFYRLSRLRNLEKILPDRY
ncbi:MFS transporter [Cyanobacterium aponinum]|uniref:MFS transporter n=1 Tax=Cyanobacterium aponinum TaxID=379064 RepID=UPI000C12B646|nr:MFS transporter [Cyanobacterium aponinum]PHV61918.1 MFS transporter [Cyanobacterium aponinum IPPAS B-1201]